MTADQRRRSTGSKKARDKEDKVNDTTRLMASRSSARLITKLPLATKTGPAPISTVQERKGSAKVQSEYPIHVRFSQKEGRDSADARRATGVQPKSFKIV